MSSSRTNMRSAGKFAARAVRLFLPLSIRKPASRSSSRLRSERRPERWSAICRRVRSTDIGTLQRVESASITLERFLPEEAAHADDRRRAHPGAVADLAIGEVGSIKQPGYVPALRQRHDLAARAKYARQLSPLPPALHPYPFIH